MNAYDEREEQLGEELMRYLERSILLQVIDNRWREHLFDMDYLREGIHLRGFAQIDPLVAYKNEGYSMFEELMHSIWEEFSKLVFRAEVEVEAGRRAAAAAAAEPDGARLLGRHRSRPSPRRCSRSPPPAAAPARSTSPPPRPPARATAVGNGAGGEVVETVVKDEHDKIGRNDPCWCGSRQEVQEVPRAGAATGISVRGSGHACVPLRPRRVSHLPIPMPDPVREFIRAFNERDLDGFVAVLDPEVELHAMRGLRKGLGGGAGLGDAGAGRGAAGDRARAALRGRDRGRRRRAVALIVRRWHWEESGELAERGSDGLGLRAARRPGPLLAALRGPRGGAARVGLRPRVGLRSLRMADAPTEAVAPRLAAVREQLSLLSDYL